ncbi:hypothetical protein RUND412_000747 [Rhizina undulata]
MATASSSSPPSAFRSTNMLKLRQELKEWEHAFALAHNDRKPTRDEVKKDAKIAAKYKEYNKLRSGPFSTQQCKEKGKEKEKEKRSTPRNDDPFAPENSTRSGHSSLSSSAKKLNPEESFQTPTKPRFPPPDADEIYESPMSLRRQRLFGNRPRDTVGPTPQKTGKVLGIFDSVVDVASTPTRSGSKPRVGFEGSPTKQRLEQLSEGRVSASPAETGDKLSTPRKRKLGEFRNEDSPTKQLRIKEPETPSFLKRTGSSFSGDPLASPVAPLPIAPPKRGLSSLLAELRKMEDEALNDDEEALREMEDMEQEINAGPVAIGEKRKPTAEFNDNLPPPPPPGAYAEEGAEDYETEEEEKKGPRWKKKGLKRQTRRVIMRPVKVNPTKPPPELKGIPEDDDEDKDGDFKDQENEEDGEETGGEDYTGKPSNNKKSKKTETADTTSDKTSIAGKGKSVAKKAVRKVSNAAHANFRKLNIRNKNSKGKKFFNRRR